MEWPANLKVYLQQFIERVPTAKDLLNVKIPDKYQKAFQGADNLSLHDITSMFHLQPENLICHAFKSQPDQQINFFYFFSVTAFLPFGVFEVNSLSK